MRLRSRRLIVNGCRMSVPLLLMMFILIIDSTSAYFGSHVKKDTDSTTMTDDGTHCFCEVSVANRHCAMWFRSLSDGRIFVFCFTAERLHQRLQLHGGHGGLFQQQQSLSAFAESSAQRLLSFLSREFAQIVSILGGHQQMCDALL